MNGSFVHQINQTAFEKHAAVVYAKLASGCSGVKLFNKLPWIFSFYIVEISLKNHLRFLGDVKYNWKESIGVSAWTNEQSWSLNQIYFQNFFKLQLQAFQMFHVQYET